MSITLGSDVGSRVALYDTSGNPIATVNTGQLVTTLKDTSGNAVFPAAAALSDTLANPTTFLVGSDTLLWDAVNSQWMRARTNLEGTLLSSAARVASVASADQTNVDSRGVAVFLHVTVNPGGAETLQLAVDMKDPVSGTYIELATLAASALAGGTGDMILPVYPGAGTNPSGGTVSVTKSLPLPRTWRAHVYHSAAGSWTYSVGYALIK